MPLEKQPPKSPFSKGDFMNRSARRRMEDAMFVNKKMLYLRTVLTAIIFILLSAYCPLSIVQAQTIRHVATTGYDTNNDCSDIENPCQTIIHAIDQADPHDTVEIAEGVYTQGFIPVEDPITFRGAGEDLTIVQAAETLEESESNVFILDDADTVRIEHLTIRHGNPPINNNPYGGGILSYQTHLTVTHSTICNNRAWLGGGISIQERTVVLIDCTIRNNITWGWGGGIKVSRSSTLLAVNCSISNNTIENGRVGGICFNTSDHIVTISLDSCIINNNQDGGIQFSAFNYVDTQSSQLTLDNCLINDNYMWQGFTGGVSCRDGNMTISNSTISGNNGMLVGAGIGIGLDSRPDHNPSADTVRIINSTVSGNDGYFEGGISAGIGGINPWRNHIYIESTTITDNTCTAPGNYGAGISICCGDSAIHLKNSIIAENYHADGTLADCLSYGQGSTIYSHGYNLIGDLGDCFLTEGPNPGTDIIGEDPLLSELLDWGGPTPTHMLLPGSPALDAGDCFDIFGQPIDYDQRGQPRPYGNGCDIGAVERQAEEVSIEDDIQTGPMIDLTIGPYLEQNYPNPFNQTTTIRYHLPNSPLIKGAGGLSSRSGSQGVHMPNSPFEGGQGVHLPNSPLEKGAQGVVSLRIYNVTGQLVRTLINRMENAGEHTVTWDGRNAQGQPVGSGLYFYQLDTKGISIRKRMILLK